MKKTVSAALFAAILITGVLPLYAKNSPLEKNVKFKRNGELYINNIPQIYGRKSYSSMAVTSMVLRYFDRKISLNDLYDVFNNTRNDEGITTRLLSTLMRNFGEFSVTRLYTLTSREAEDLVNAYNDFAGKKRAKRTAPQTVREYEKIFRKMKKRKAESVFNRERKELVKATQKMCREYLYAGVPVLWSSMMCFDPDVTATGIQARLVVGYVEKEGRVTEIIYRDSSTKHIDLKRVTLEEFVTMTYELLVVAPRSFKTQEDKLK